MHIKVTDLINSQNALLHDDGLLVFHAVEAAFNANPELDIDVDFSDVRRCSTLFLNASFGKLLALYGPEVIRKHIRPVKYAEMSTFMERFKDMWDNFENRDNFQAYRDMELA